MIKKKYSAVSIFIKVIAICNIILGIHVSNQANAQSQWKYLIGNDLSNWTQRGGSSLFSLEGGEIIGKTEAGPTSEDAFLCTKENFDNFIIEFDCLGDMSLNSGLNFRSQITKDGTEGVVMGYQVEIDPTARSWSGGIYEQSGRKWLYTLDENPLGKLAFKSGSWNHFRLEAFGSSIRTWVNGIPCADLIDDNLKSGFIGLQVHSIGNDSSKRGKNIRFKNIRIIAENVENYLTPAVNEIPQNSYLTNELSEREKKEGWKLLWDGKSVNGWEGVENRDFLKKGWKIENGMLTKYGGDGGEDIISEGLFDNFILIVDFKYAFNSNSGIKYLVQSQYENNKRVILGCEFQILDDEHHEDAIEGVEGNRKLGSLYDVIPPRKTRDNGIDRWNRCKIIVRGNHVEHWLNGQKTLEYDRNSDMWNALVSKSKFKDHSGFGNWEGGKIFLQGKELGQVSFRNIKVIKLGTESD